MGFVPTIGEVPFYLAFGAYPVFPTDLWSKSDEDLIVGNAIQSIKTKTVLRIKHAEEMVRAWRQAGKVTDTARDGALEHTFYEVGDLVWYHKDDGIGAMAAGRGKKRLSKRVVGPYRVLERLALKSYRLKNLETGKLLLGSSDLMTPVRSTVLHERFKRKDDYKEPTELISETDIVRTVPERIVGKKQDPDLGLCYRVRWRNFDDDEDTWES